MSSIKDISLGSDNSIYLKLVEGITRIRICSEIIPIWTEFDRANKKATKYLSEELAAEHPEAKKRYGFWCIDRTDGKIRMAEMGISVMKQIQTLALDPDYNVESDIFPYDVKVLKEGSGMETSYSVTPSPATPLTPEEQALIVGLEGVESFFGKQPGVITKKADKSEVPF